MESPEMPGSPTEYDDEVVYPCKGCGEILEEGKAFELANNRWHIDCFRCNTCGTLLDSDANLLLLADGSLICNQCTYSCTACGNKIEDLAILTGDQAFCAGCFRCRNCKRKIENLRYARTSQGIFCMSCHESLMARRRKKQKSSRQTLNAVSSPQLALDKSLPAIPQDLDDDDQQSTFSETPTELSPRPVRPTPPTARPAATSRSDQLSPSFAENHPRMPRPYNNNRHSQIYHHPELAELGSTDPDPYAFIPLALDPSTPAPLQNTTYRADSTGETTASRKERPDVARSHSANSEPPAELEVGASEGLGRKPVPTSAPAPTQPPPHIAYQEKGRQPSHPVDRQEVDRKPAEKKASASSTDASPYPSRTSSRTAHAAHTEATANSGTSSKLTTVDTHNPENKQRWDTFKLGEVPNDRKKALISPGSGTATDEISISFSPTRPAPLAAPSTKITPAEPPKKREDQPPQKPRENKASDSNQTTNQTQGPYSHSASGSNSSGNTTIDLSELPPPIHRKEVPQRVPVPTSRITAADTQKTAPKYENLSLGQENSLMLSLRTPGGDFSMDEDIARMLGSEGSSSPSLLRKVSNAVRHGRSFSDLAGRTGLSPKWHRSPNQGHGRKFSGHVLTRATVTSESAISKEEVSTLKAELKRATQRNAELELRLSTLAPDGRVDISKIDEQRLLIAKLESEREVRVRELEVLVNAKENWAARFPPKGGDTEDMERKEFDALRKDAIRNLAKELEDVRNSYEAQVQALAIQRSFLVDENGKLSNIRDQTIQDTEQLNMKNAQLMELNNEITRQIQGRFQSHKGTISTTSGLGITNRDGTELEFHRPQTGGTATSATVTNNSIHDMDDDGHAILQPTLVDVPGRSKPGNFKKSWKKGGAAIIKGAGKGFNKVFMTETPGGQPHQGLQGYQYEASSSAPLPEQVAYLPRSATAPDAQGGFDKLWTAKKFGGNKKTGPHGKANGSFSATNASGLVILKEDEQMPLFGSDLESRAAYEGKSIPYVVSRCIQEVEARGMDFEGIYRKSGGAHAIRQIQEAFERGEELDIGDPVDICGVTSVLKQYFRKLPTPIITPAIYDDFLNATRFSADERVNEIKDVMNQLSPVHHDVLGYVIFHLRKVSEKEQKNLMSTRNLAVVFAPTLMWHEDKEREMTDMHEKNNAIQFLIENGEAIFFS